ncbi:hypothetical protein NCAS_0C03560 [Naumovozyma castellii]|uniref:Protein kinase domain-containing protein n=1 Tax=Naumovozyma castellii TaxID=27288 RepID=G0VCY5_NAUCA|nr:hypothetical protein NCAS_0C03560 [Naumovozyma castellii CBS 4309]CCC69346.1 hypothetical protein NCAS_0C03560 [Naumovozyma castellii CBS 4309]
MKSNSPMLSIDKILESADSTCSSIFTQSNNCQIPSDTTIPIYTKECDIYAKHERYNDIMEMQREMKDQITFKTEQKRLYRWRTRSKSHVLGPARRSTQALNKTTAKSHLSDLENINEPKRESILGEETGLKETELGELNPFQYLKKNNLPTKELSRLTKLYCNRKLDETRSKKTQAIDAHEMNSSSDQLEKRQRKVTTTTRSIYDKNRIIPSNVKNRLKKGTSGKLQSGRIHQPYHLSVRNEQKALSQCQQEMPTANEQAKLISKKLVSERVDYLIRDYNSKIQNKKHQTIPKIEAPVPQSVPSQANLMSKQWSRITDEELSIVELLGKGGSSKVYKVQDRTGKYYALKQILLEELDENLKTDLEREIELLKRLAREERVVKLIEYKIDDRMVQVLMECGNFDLSHVLHERVNRPFDINFVRLMSKEMIECIKAVHDSDIVHSDLKPANFIFVKGTLKLIDFGIANKIADNTLNVYRNTQMGTPNYMAPETLISQNYSNNNNNLLWKIGKPSDIWSYGCILYQMTYGHPPYSSFLGHDRLLAIMNPNIQIDYPNESPCGKKVPQSLVALIKTCLNRDPQLRATTDEIQHCSFFNPMIISKPFLESLIDNAINYGIENQNITQDRIKLLSNEVVSKLSTLNL